MSDFKKKLVEFYSRPELSSRMSSITFREYYYSREELVDFCRTVGLAVSGNKVEIGERIICFLDTGEKLSPAQEVRNRQTVGTITPEDVIEENIVCSERHRAFFRDHIGSRFTFNVEFQKWLKLHAGSSYADAIEVWYALKADKRKKPIDSQFEYNRYIRDFFAANPGMTLQDAIRCWKYKKMQAGQHCYEEADLAVLNAESDI